MGWLCNVVRQSGCGFLIEVHLVVERALVVVVSWIQQTDKTPQTRRLDTEWEGCIL